jgi:hypothetical protein
MPFDRDTLYATLPAVYRLRDTDRTLYALVSLLAEQAEILEEDVRGLYDDLFIETCADWVVPYIGDLLGVTPMHSLSDRPGGSRELEGLRALLAPRAQVANTLELRRRKGTAAALEELAENITGWRARVVEMFRMVAISAHVNHPRPEATVLDVRNVASAELHQPFERAMRTPDFRAMNGVARRHVPNVAIFLFRLRAAERSHWPATVAPVSARHFWLSPLACNTRLFHRELSEPSLSHLAERVHLAGPISPRAMSLDLEAHYGPGRSFAIRADGVEVLPAPGQVIGDLIEVADLGDDPAGGWSFDPAAKWRIDPLRGRLLSPGDRPPPQRVEVSFHEGAVADLGGGQYDRSSTTRGEPDARVTSAADNLHPIQAGIIQLEHPALQGALSPIEVLAGQTLELRAADGVFAQLRGAPLVVRGLGPGARFVLSGVRLRGHLRLEGSLASFELRDSTLIPGRSLDAAGLAVEPGTASLTVATATRTAIRIERSITGPIELLGEAELSIDASIVDAGAPESAALTGADLLDIRASTVIGRIAARRIERIADSILWARTDGANLSIAIERRQQGHLCFSWLPLDAGAPARHRCVPQGGDFFEPELVSRRYGDAAYGQLRKSARAELLKGASDESELGVFHDQYEPLREANLRNCLDDFIRVGLDADLVFAS